jgi:hypothetical protein
LVFFEIVEQGKTSRYEFGAAFKFIQIYPVEWLPVEQITKTLILII